MFGKPENLVFNTGYKNQRAKTKFTFFNETKILVNYPL